MTEHYLLLIQWNRRMNLTRVADPEEAAQRHFAESLAFQAARPGDWASAVDVGSGAGFPGLALAAVNPARSVTLLEPVGKKAVFLREVSRAWGNVVVRDVRVEAYREECDWAWMRAVNVRGALRDLGRVGRRLGLWVSLDGVRAARESKDWEWREPIALPGGSERQLLMGLRRST